MVSNALLRVNLMVMRIYIVFALTILGCFGSSKNQRSTSDEHSETVTLSPAVEKIRERTDSVTVQEIRHQGMPIKKSAAVDEYGTASIYFCYNIAVTPINSDPIVGTERRLFYGLEGSVGETLFYASERVLNQLKWETLCRSIDTDTQCQPASAYTEAYLDIERKKTKLNNIQLSELTHYDKYEFDAASKTFATVVGSSIVRVTQHYYQETVLKDRCGMASLGNGGFSDHFTKLELTKYNPSVDFTKYRYVADIHNAMAYRPVASSSLPAKAGSEATTFTVQSTEQAFDIDKTKFLEKTVGSCVISLHPTAAVIYDESFFHTGYAPFDAVVQAGDVLGGEHVLSARIPFTFKLSNIEACGAALKGQRTQLGSIAKVSDYKIFLHDGTSNREILSQLPNEQDRLRRLLKKDQYMDVFLDWTVGHRPLIVDAANEDVNELQTLPYRLTAQSAARYIGISLGGQ
jgi:hypothetical protein